jgi:uncharacterized protein (DUF983 family)
MKKDKKIQFKITTIIIGLNTRKLKPGWKSWFCPKCGEGWLYRGKRPKHKNCLGQMQCITSEKCEQELIECMAEEIKKEIKNERKINRNYTKR